MTTITAAEQAARGAALLDAEVPDWAERIDLAVLDLADEHRCVLGQIVGDDTDRLGNTGYCLGVVRLNGEYSGSWAVKHGFCAYDGHYDALTFEWLLQIKERVA